MSEREYIEALQRDLAVLATTIEQRDRELAAAKETIKATVTRAIEAERRVETMRQIACAIAANTNKIQRIAAGEE